MNKEQLKFSNSELIVQVQTLYRKIKRVPSVKDFNDAAYTACYCTVKKQFGSWKNFLLAAGIIQKATKEDLIRSCQKLAKKLHRIPTSSEFLEYRKDIISMDTIKKLFGGMRNFAKEAEINDQSPYTEEAMLLQLHSLALELKHAPSEKEFDEAKNTINSRTVLRKFGSWETFLATAGYKSSAKKGRPRTEKQIVEKQVKAETLKQQFISNFCALGKELKRIPTSKEFELSSGGTTLYHIKTLFKTWANFVEVSGIHDQVLQVIKEDLLKKMQDLATNLEKTPNENDFRLKYSGFETRLVRRHFGKWSDFIEAASLDSIAKSKRKVIIRQFLSLKAELGRNPTRKEFDQHLDTVTVATVLGYFDSWDSLAAEAMRIAI